ncbi:MAG: TonB family protein, partial [Elusimicrobiota bacterium]
IDGKVDYTATDNTVYNADGSTTETVTRKNANGAAIGSIATTTSGNGLSITTATDENGDGVIDLTRTDVTVIGTDGSRTETVTDINGTAGSLRDKTVTVTSASGTSVSIARDTTGLGYNSQTETIVTSSTGNTVDTVSHYAANKSLTGQTATTTSANGLTKTVQVDANGDGVFDKTQIAATVYNSDGGTTVTTTQKNGTTVTGATIATTAANGLSSTTLELDGSGSVLDTRWDGKTIGADGSTAQTVADTSNNNTLIGETVTWVSSDGKTTVISSDNNGASYNGAPVYGRVETIAQQPNGSITDTVQAFNASGAPVAKTVKTAPKPVDIKAIMAASVARRAKVEHAKQVKAAAAAAAALEAQRKADEAQAEAEVRAEIAREKKEAARVKAQAAKEAKARRDAKARADAQARADAAAARAEALAEAKAAKAAKKAELSQELATMSDPDNALAQDAASPPKGRSKAAAAAALAAGTEAGADDSSVDDHGADLAGARKAGAAAALADTAESTDPGDAAGSGGADLLDAKAKGGGTGPDGAGVSYSLDGPVGSRRVLRRTVPVSPDWVGTRGLDLAVTVRFQVLPDGTVKPGAVIRKTSGFPEIDRLALDALRKWRFESIPAGDGPEVWGRVTFRFTS